MLPDLKGLEGLSHLVAILTFLGGLLWFGYGLFLLRTTKPVAGYIDVMVPAAGEECPVFIRKWRVFNPGPGVLTGVTLEVDVSDNYETQTKSFTTGLTVTNGSGVKHSVEKHGGGYRVRFVPAGNQLNRFSDLRCQFHIRQETWSANGATVVLVGNVPFDANIPFKSISPSTSDLGWPVSLIVIGAFIGAVNFFRAQRIEENISYQVAQAIERERPNIVAAASIETLQSLQDATLDRLPSATPDPPALHPPQ